MQNFSVALFPPTIPATGKPTFRIGTNEIYFGWPGHIKTEIFAHNDPYAERMLLEEKPLKRLGKLIIVAGGRGTH